MRLSEDVIRYLTVKQEGPLPTPRTSNKTSKQTEPKEIDSKDTKVKEEAKKEDLESSNKSNLEVKETIES